MHWASKQKSVRTPTKSSALPTKMHLRLQAYRYCSALPSKMQRASMQNAACFQAKCSALPSKMQHGLKKMQCAHKQYTAHFPGMCFVFLGKMLSAKRWYHRSYSNEELETNRQIFHQGDGNKITIENWVLSNTVECDRRSYNWHVGFPLFFLMGLLILNPLPDGPLCPQLSDGPRSDWT
jgi:hypothetical protein